ncbi:MAG: hydrolase TatD, partial [Muribaculaceae bacterium]|nr:hydrolase TatD [Muribaculaceae bacterium]
MIDTHTHIYMDKFAADGNDGCGLAVDRAVAAGVGMMVLPCVDIESASEIAALHRARPDRVRTA